MRRERTQRRNGRAPGGPVRRAGRLARSVCTALIPLDTARIRAKHVGKCKRVMAAFERDQAALRIFYEQDLPVYRRLVHMTFGPLISEMRELEEKLQRESILEAMAEREHTPGTSLREAYARAQRKMEHPEELSEDEPQTAQDAPAGDGWDDGDDDDGNAWVFEQVRAKFLKQIGQHLRNMGIDVDSMLRAERAAHDKDIRDRYRQLCRMLHPDCGAAMTDDTRALWQEVQEAYQAQDIEALDELLARAELRNGTLHPGTTIARIIEVIGHMEQARRTVRQQLRDAQRDAAWECHAWDEARIKDAMTAAERALRYERDRAANALDEREAYRTAVMQPGKSRRMKARRAPWRPAPPPDARQANFRF